MRCQTRDTGCRVESAIASATSPVLVKKYSGAMIAALRTHDAKPGVDMSHGSGRPASHTVNVSELAERLQLRHHSAVELIDRLETDKMVKRESDESDGRKVLIGLTGHGERVLERLSEAHREQLDRIGPQLTRLLNELTGKR